MPFGKLFLPYMPVQACSKNKPQSRIEAGVWKVASSLIKPLPKERGTMHTLRDAMRVNHENPGAMLDALVPCAVHMAAPPKAPLWCCTHRHCHCHPDDKTS